MGQTLQAISIAGGCRPSCPSLRQRRERDGFAPQLDPSEDDAGVCERVLHPRPSGQSLGRWGEAVGEGMQHFVLAGIELASDEEEMASRVHHRPLPSRTRRARCNVSVVQWTTSLAQLASLIICPRLPLQTFLRGPEVPPDDGVYGPPDTAWMGDTAPPSCLGVGHGVVVPDVERLIDNTLDKCPREAVSAEGDQRPARVCSEGHGRAVEGVTIARMADGCPGNRAVAYGECRLERHSRNRVGEFGIGPSAPTLQPLVHLSNRPGIASGLG